jgi:hypothetical protein
MPAPMRSWLCLPLSASLIGLGCSTSRLAESDDNAPTLIRLAPEAFLGEMRCMPGSAGALQAYSVRVFQLGTERDAGVPVETELATSAPVSCINAVSFQAIGGRRYVADISGYDQEPADAVAPRWAASCGRGPDGIGPALDDVGSNEFGATRANLNTTVPIVGCTYLGQVAPGATDTRVVVSLAAALGELQCGSGPGQVSDFVAVLDEQRQAASCGAEVSFGDVPLDTELLIQVSAFSGGALLSDAGASDASTPGAPPVLDAGADAAPSDAGALDAAAPPAGASDAGTGRVPQWTTQCRARALAGVVTRAECEPLQPVLD